MEESKKTGIESQRPTETAHFCLDVEGSLSEEMMFELRPKLYWVNLQTLGEGTAREHVLGRITDQVYLQRQREGRCGRYTMRRGRAVCVKLEKQVGTDPVNSSPPR